MHACRSTLEDPTESGPVEEGRRAPGRSSDYAWRDYFREGFRDDNGYDHQGEQALTLYQTAMRDMTLGWRVPETWHEYLAKQASLGTLTAPPPDFTPGYSALELTQAADATAGELKTYYERYLGSSYGDAAQSKLYALLSDAHGSLKLGTTKLWRAVDQAVGQVGEGYQIAAAEGVVVSGNKESVRLTYEAAAKIKESVEAMKEARPTKGPDVDVSVLARVLAAVADEEAFTATIAARIEELRRRVNELTPEQALEHLAAVAEKFPGIERIEAGMGSGVDRNRLASAEVRADERTLAFGVRREELRDAVAARRLGKTYRERAEAARQAGMTAIERTAEAKRAVLNAVEELDKARRRIEVCTAMQKASARAADEEARKIAEINVKLEALGAEYDAALAAGTGAEEIAAKAALEIAKAKEGGTKTEYAGRGAAMANVAAMEALSDAVAALRYASAQVGGQS